MLVLGPDGKSIRVFSRQLGARSLDFYGQSVVKPSDIWALVDEANPQRVEL